MAGEAGHLRVGGWCRRRNMSRAFIIAVPHAMRRMMSACGHCVGTTYGQIAKAITAMDVVIKVNGVGALEPRQKRAR